MNVTAPAEQRPAIDRFRAAVAVLRERIATARPDVAIVFAPDHFRTLFYENMPAFCIGVGTLDGWGDWSTPAGPFPVAVELGRHVLRSVLAAGFDPAHSHRLRADHGLTQPLALLGIAQLPVVPILVNAAAPPLPTPARCYAFGEALAAAIASYPGRERIAVVGSGGLSHAPPSVAIESTDPLHADAVEQLIAGREHVRTREAARQAALVATVDRYASGINPAWDAAVLERFARGDVRALAGELDEASIERDAGNGAQEIRTWLAAAAVAGGTPMETLGYEPIPFFITGMGVAASPVFG